MRREFVQFQLPLVCLLVPNQLQKNTKLRRGNTWGYQKLDLQYDKVS